MTIGLTSKLIKAYQVFSPHSIPFNFSFPYLLVPKCTRSGVQTVPSMEILLKMTKDELMNVNDFTISKEDVGKVTFPGLTDVRGLDLDRIVSFKDREITLYPNDSDKPASGEGMIFPDIFLYSLLILRFKQTSRHYFIQVFSNR